MTLERDHAEPASGAVIEADEGHDHAAQDRALRRAERARRRSARPAGPPADGGGESGLLRTRAGRTLVAGVAAVAIATVLGLVVFWPGASGDHKQQAFGGRSLGAVVTAARTARCPGPVRQRCRTVAVRVTDGADRGRRATLDLGPVNATPRLVSGTRVRVERSAPGDPAPYAFVDVDRRVPMIWLAIGLGVLAAIVARLRGILALVGVVLSVGLVVAFLVPAILAGSDPVLVSLTAALAVMFITVLLTYGFGAQSLAACVGIALSLLLAALIGHVMVAAAHLDGRTGELQQLLVLGARGVSLQGVVLAGMVVGALGVLTDMAVSQASAVAAVHRVDPLLGPRELYRSAFAVGRDHLAATVHTLVLAYVGAALPLILVLRDADVGALDAVNGQIMAEPIIATLVGAIALIAAVPVTTALAAVLVVPVPPNAISTAGHPHTHTH
jgi:uncharacterized membrane protein